MAKRSLWPDLPMRRASGGCVLSGAAGRKGLAQITLVKKLLGKEAFKSARTISRESVVLVKGTVKAEPKAIKSASLFDIEFRHRAVSL